MRVLLAPSFIVIAMMVGTFGCSKKPVLGKVSGTVTFGSEPLNSGTIVFENREAGIAINAKINEDGSFEVRTHEGAGLPAGSYVVAISLGGTMKDGSESPLAGGERPPPPPPSKNKIPDPYHSTATSPLRAEVKPGNNPPFHFDVSP